MRTNLRPLLQWLILAVFIVLGTILAILICGEENPTKPLSISDFLLIKAIAMVSAYATYKAAKWCYSRDYFPALVHKYFELCDKIEENK